MTATATDFDFAEVEIPLRQAGPGRPADPNPFIDKVGELIEADGSLRDVAVSFTLADSAESEAANRVRRQLARAGIVHNVSVFKRVEDSPEGSLVTFWAQTRIVPQRRPKGEDVEADDGGDQGDEGTSAPLAESVSTGITSLEP